MRPRKANVLYGYRQDNFVQINAPPVACAALHMQALKESMGEFSVFQESEAAVGMRRRPCGAHAMWIGTTNVSAIDSQEQATTAIGLQPGHVGLCLDFSA